EIAALSRIAAPDCAVITNVGDAHLLQLGSREAIALAKFEITAGLKQGGALVYHGDEPLLAELVRQQVDQLPAERIRIGLAPDNDCYPADVSVSLAGCRFAVCRKGEGVAISDVAVPLTGRHNAVNAMAAAAIAR